MTDQELSAQKLAELREAAAGWPVLAALVSERDRLAAAVERVRALTYESDDGTVYRHDGHSPIDGYPECPGCWSDGILATLDGADDE